MLLDQNLLLDTAHALTATAASTNVVDLVNARDIAVGKAHGATPTLMVLVTTTFSTTNSGTLTVQFQGSTDNSTFTTYAESRAYTAGELVAGNRLFDDDIPRPSGGAATPRYLRLNYVVANAFTAGAVTAAIVLGRDDLIAYPPGVAVVN
jgi:hypothetical protein